MLIVVCNCLYTAGLENAKDKEKYYIANDYEDKIIVHKTTEYYILMDENNKILEHQYEIVPSSEIGKISYKVTGKLSVEEI